MNSVVVEALSAYRAEVDAGRTMVQGRASRGGERRLYNVHMDNELYEWLRTTAFYAHISTGAVIVAALVHARMREKDTMTARPRRDRLPADAPTPPGHVITCRLPVEAYEWLRLTAFQKHQRMTSVALAAITAYRAEVEGGHITRERLPRVGGETTVYSIQLDDDRYEWLRTIAFRTHTSINALVVAALTRAQADQTEGTPRS